MSQGQAPVKIAIAGGGNRGRAYAGWITANPDQAQLVAVAEPRDAWREFFLARSGLPDSAAYSTWEEMAEAAPDADMVIVATQDADHVDPVIAFAERGYHILVEKPMAPTEEDCLKMVDAIRKSGVLFGVCHLMRYTPYTAMVKQIVDSGRLGRIMSIQHLEPVGHWHHAHSYVRGNWRREDLSSPMLLAKSCHDIDWLRYIVGAPIERVSSFGSLTHFRPENKPAGAADRCMDCAIEPDCAYSAKRLYLGMVERGHTRWPVDVVVPDPTIQGVERALREGPYGRCVWACDNDVVDHQVVGLEFGGEVTGTFTMTAFSKKARRRTQIFGTLGEFDGDGETATVFDFLTETTTTENAPSAGDDAGSGHSGGDAGVISSFVRAVRTQDPEAIKSGPLESLETHLAVFAAERARHAGTVEPVRGLDEAVAPRS